MKYLLILLISFTTQAEYVDIKINTKNESVLSTLFHIKSNILFSSEFKDNEMSFFGAHYGYRSKDFFIAAGYELLNENNTIYNGATLTTGYKPKTAEYAIDLQLRYNESFKQLEKSLGVHYRYSEKVYMTIGTDLTDSLYVGIRRWL